MSLQDQPWYDEDAASRRFRTGLVFAVLLHTAVLTLVIFVPEKSAPRARSLDVTLATFKDDQAPEEADFLAQNNQLGSGERAARSDTSTPLPSEFNAALVQQQARESGAPPPAQSDWSPVLQSRQGTWQQSADQQTPRPQPDPVQPQAADTPQPVVQEIESLMARLDQQQQAYAKLPRVHRMTSVSARQTDDAAYLQAWKARVETIGNANYPPEARRRKLHGDLRLLVSLRPDGSVVQIRVLQSSGHAVLDYAAMRIVRMAAPFDPFPPELRARADVLEIIRTWQFRNDLLTASD